MEKVISMGKSMIKEGENCMNDKNVELVYRFINPSVLVIS